MSYPIDEVVTSILYSYGLEISFSPSKDAGSPLEAHVFNVNTGKGDTFHLGIDLPSPAYAMDRIGATVLFWCGIITQEQSITLAADLSPELYGEYVSGDPAGYEARRRARLDADYRREYGDSYQNYSTDPELAWWDRQTYGIGY